jgi:hypothetical protein
MKEVDFHAIFPDIRLGEHQISSSEGDPALSLGYMSHWSVSAVG